MPAAPLDPFRIRAIIFDVDGTLSDSDDRMVERIQNNLRFLRGAIDESKLKLFSRWLVHAAEGPGNWLLETADRLRLDHLVAAFFDRRANTREYLAHHYPLIPGVVPMLEALASRYPFAIVTARNEVTTSQFLEINNLERFFPLVVSSQTCQRTKPFPDPLLHAAEKMVVPIDACLMVGDTVTDVRAALAAGAQSLSVLCGFGTEAELQKSGTNAILPSTSTLADFLTEAHFKRENT
ncbi:MAG: HAD family hydrolase [Chloroflexi bacterium]|nr:HAD family hydrolase [Chloroflexota bacterium]